MKIATTLSVALLLALLLGCGNCRGQVAFDGSKSYIDSGFYPFHDLTNYSISCWAYHVEDMDNQCVFLGFNENGVASEENIVAMFFYTNTFFVLDERQNSMFSATHAVDFNVTNLHFYCQVYDADSLRGYIDGEEVCELATGVNPPIIGNVERTTIGARGYGGSVAQFFNGTIDDARVYSRALSAVEINEIYSKPWVLSDDPALVLRTCVPDLWDETMIADVNGNGNSITNHGAILQQTADGWTADLDGVGDYVDCGVVGLTNFTFCSWFMVDSTSGYNTVYSYSGVNAQLRTYNDSLNCYSGGESILTNANIQEGKEFFVAHVKDSGQQFLYLDGELLASASADPINQTGRVYLATRYYLGAFGLFFDGRMSDTRLYSRSLSSNEISQIYSTRHALVDDASLVLCLPMQPTYQNTGTTLAGIAPNLGSGPDGSYSNGPTVAPGVIRHSEPRHRAMSQRTEYDLNLIRDMSGNGSTATNNGVALYQTSEGWVGRFDGNDDCVSTGIIPNSTQKTSVIRFSMPSYTTGTHSLLGLYEGSRWYFMLSHSSFPNKMLVGTYDTYVQIDETNIPLNEMVQVAFCADGTNISAYINDFLCTQYVANVSTFTVPLFLGTQNRTIGPDYFSTCIINDFSHYTNALSINDISNLYHHVSIPYTAAATYTMQPELQP